MRETNILLLAVLFVITTPALAQPEVQVQEAQLSVPFGVIEGKVVLVEDYLIFVDEDRPEASFAVSRSNLRRLSVDNFSVSIETDTPVRDRSGQRDQLTLRLMSSVDAAMIEDWSERGGTATQRQRAERAEEPPSQEATQNYQVLHGHGFLRGECRGQLVVSERGLSYDSVDDISHSRQWQFQDIRELEHDDPYELKVDLFVGSDYEFVFVGSGMSNEEFSDLAERVTRSRVRTN